jgi:serine/threonine protein kinase/F0F1-type ATP synthase assembly protein I
MSLLLKISSFALRPVLGGAAKLILQGIDFKLTDEAVSAVESYFVTRFTDPSKNLRNALSRAADRSWLAVEIALCGESLWSRLTDRGEDKAFRTEIRTFLDSNPLQVPQGRDEAFRRNALNQLRTARKTGLIPGNESSATTAAKQSTDFLRFADPSAVCEAEWRVMGEVAAMLRQAGHTALADLVELRPVANQPPLLAVAVRFFFRREIEGDRQLFQGLLYEQVDQLGQTLEAGFGRLDDALQNHNDRILEILGLTEAIQAGVLDLKAEQARQGDRLGEIYSAVSSLGEKLDRLHERSLRQDDATSVRGGVERQLIKAVKGKFRALPEGEREKAPALLNAIGKLALAAGDYDEAQQDFRQLASIVDDRAAKAEAHHGAFLAAAEKRDWTTALKELLEATRLDPERFALFPVDRYEPERILGAGGFGIVFLCRNRLSKARMVVKSLRTDELDRDLSAVLQEAGALEQLNHDSIIRLRDCGCADAKQTRPYLVMDYFDGVTLEDHVKQHGPLAVTEARVIACQMAEGLAVAHAKDILHRDVKPGNLLIERTAAGLRVKLIDFGLAMRQRAVHTTMTNASALSNTIRGQSIAGTLDYASPEQMGKLPGEAVSRKSDVYGFGRTLCFALFGTPNPTFSHWLKLQDEQFRELLNECITDTPKTRPDGFPLILDRLGWTSAHQPQPVPLAPAIAAPIEVSIPAVPAAQVAPSDLPPLPQDVLTLEGRLNGLRQTIETVEHGQHPDLRAGWKALDGHTTSGGQPLIESLKQRIEKTPSCRDSELCALAPDAPQWAVLVAINALKRLVELKGERAEVQRQLARRQEEDFRGILVRFLAQSAGEKFPLTAWMTLEPKLAVRRYVFVGNLRELLQKAEEHFASICEERKAERLRLEREREERRRQDEAAARQREAEQRQRQAEAARRQRIQTHYIGSGLAGAIICSLILGGLGWLLGTVGWTTIVFPLIGLVLGAIVGAIAGLPLGSVVSSYNNGRQANPCECECGYQWGKVDEDTVKGFAIFGAIVGGIGGIIKGIMIVGETPIGSYPTWEPGAGLLWAGLAGAVIGLIVGLIVAANNEPN